MVLVGDRADAAADWIAEHISAADVCVTSDLPLAARCVERQSGWESSDNLDENLVSRRRHDCLWLMAQSSASSDRGAAAQ